MKGFIERLKKRGLSLCQPDHIQVLAKTRRTVLACSWASKHANPERMGGCTCQASQNMANRNQESIVVHAVVAKNIRRVFLR
eukprot:scaffold1170_cov174-Amphora_coffeaeformis.AAC.4